jgi:pectate lyase
MKRGALTSVVVAPALLISTLSANLVLGDHKERKGRRPRHTVLDSRMLYPTPSPTTSVSTNLLSPTPPPTASPVALVSPTVSPPAAPQPTPTATAPPSSESAKAFPTAEGFGASTPGGRGGYICEVTNLNDAGAGSFRACAEASGARIVVFRVGGTITVTEKVTVRDPNLTIAGQTAPGGGITLRSSANYDQGPFSIKTHDVVVRYMRFRPGASTAPSSMRDGITIEAGAHDIILDHLSLSWATDENLSATDGTRNLTVQWSIISEGLSHSTHSEGEHSKGALFSGKQFASSAQTGNITLHHNLLAHNRDRNPRHDAYGTVDVINNVVYDYGHVVAEANDGSGVKVPMNFVGNYIKAGPSSKPGTYEVEVDDDLGLGAELYLRDNIGPHRTDDLEPEDVILEPEDRQYVVAVRHPAPSVVTSSATIAYETVLAGAGARVPALDAVDQRVIKEVLNGTGRIIDNPTEVGGWPTLVSGTATSDTDHDGMGNEWELSHGLDPNDSSDGATLASSGYTNVESYLNELAGDLP